MEDLTFEDFNEVSLKKFKVKDLKDFIKNKKLYKPYSLKRKQEYIDFLVENKNVVYGLEKQKNILRKLNEERTTIYSMDEVCVGIDEAGQGACAGDLFIGLVVLPKHHDDTRWDYLTDSKQLSHSQRDILFDYIKDIAIEYVIHRVTPEEIDEHNIYRAKMKGFIDGLFKIKTDYSTVLVDGPSFPKLLPDSLEEKKVECVIKGDGIYKSIAAASILAKVSRDRYIEELGKTYPEYKWSSNKGYCQPEHFSLIEKYGNTKYHRRSFGVCKTVTKIYYKDKNV